MKKWLKRLFCCHVWKDENEVFLTRKKECNLVMGIITFNTYNYYAVTQECLKCEHHRVDKRRTLVI